MRCAGAAQRNAPSIADGHAKPTKRCSWSAETLAAAGTSSMVARAVVHVGVGLLGVRIEVSGGTLANTSAFECNPNPNSNIYGGVTR